MRLFTVFDINNHSFFSLSFFPLPICCDSTSTWSMKGTELASISFGTLSMSDGMTHRANMRAGGIVVTGMAMDLGVPRWTAT